MSSASPKAGLSRKPPSCSCGNLGTKLAFVASRNHEAHPAGFAFMRLNLLHSICILGLCLLGEAPCGFGQIFSVGVAGGVGLTDGIESQTNGGYHFYSFSKDYIVGPMIELNLPLQLSVEADALYRPLSLASYISLDNGVNTAVARSHVTTWEFPLLAKYKFPFPVVKPFVELGPSFRAAGNTDGTSPSDYGVTLGGGVEAHLLRLKIAPQLRYTHWAPDSTSPALILPVTNQNQVEFLVGLSF
jgi:hypothetical protein